MNRVSHKNILVGLMMLCFNIQAADDYDEWMQAHKKGCLVLHKDLLDAVQARATDKFDYQELSLGLLIGSLAVMVIHKYYNFTDQLDLDESVEKIGTKKEKSSTILTPDQRRKFLQQGFSHFDTTAVDFDRVISMTSKFTKSQLDRFIKIVTKSAIEYDIDFLQHPQESSQLIVRHPIRMSLIHLALDEMHGGSKKDRFGNNVYDDQDRMKTALHEAGHALAIIEQPNCCLRFVSTMSRELSGGRNIYARSKRADYQSLQDCQHEIVVALCGGLAEQMFGFDKTWYKNKNWVYKEYQTRAKISKELIDLISRSSVKDDIRQAKEMAVYIIENKMIEPSHFDNHKRIDMELEVNYILQDCYDKAVAFLADRKEDMKKIAALLLTQDIICGQEIYALFKL